MEKKLLIVDDEAEILETLEEALTDKGYAVRTAGSAEEAIPIARSENIQVMFLDLKLPGISGLDLCRRLKTDNPVACIFAMTGYTKIFELAACRECGFDDYFIKPIKIKQFIKAAEDAFEKISRWRKKPAV